jgi:putative heme iron utilization protein
MEKHPTLALVSCRAHGAAAAAVLSREMELCRQVEHDNKLSVVSIMVEKKKVANQPRFSGGLGSLST